jgi:formate dehydrogenase major subunit
MPYNWGYQGLSQGPSTNLITIDAGDPNTWCQETKACLVNITAEVEDKTNMAALAVASGGERRQV